MVNWKTTHRTAVLKYWKISSYPPFLQIFWKAILLHAHDVPGVLLWHNHVYMAQPQHRTSPPQRWVVVMNFLEKPNDNNISQVQLTMIKPNLTPDFSCDTLNSSGRRSHSAINLNGKLLIFGGYNGWVTFDLITNVVSENRSIIHCWQLLFNFQEDKRAQEWLVASWSRGAFFLKERNFHLSDPTSEKKENKCKILFSTAVPLNKVSTDW